MYQEARDVQQQHLIFSSQNLLRREKSLLVKLLVNNILLLSVLCRPDTLKHNENGFLRLGFNILETIQATRFKFNMYVQFT